MKKMIPIIVILGLAAAPVGAERPRLDGREAPRATDLLRAEKLADQVKRRLEMPRQRGAGWKHGGSGWGEPEPPAASEPRDVIIDLRAPRRRRAPQP